MRYGTYWSFNKNHLAIIIALILLNAFIAVNEWKLLKRKSSTKLEGKS